MEIRGFFGQVLNVGDRIAFVATSGTSYMLVGVIESIEEEPGFKYDYETRKYVPEPHPKVKIRIVKPNFKKWVYDPKTKTGEYITYRKEYVQRIYNWTSAITLPEIPETA